MWPSNRLTELLGISLPIVQAPMAGSSTLDMATAVSTAGGLGSLGCAVYNIDTLRETVSSFRQRCQKPLNLNFFVHTPPNTRNDLAWINGLSAYYAEQDLPLPTALGTPLEPFGDEQCTVIEECCPEVVSFHFGLPDDALLTRVKRSGAKVMSSATTVAEARWLAEHGCDAVIAQGYEAGGHRGMFLTDDVSSQMGTLSLVPQCVDAVDVPIIAAGGIADGRGVAAAFALGAHGVQVGTAYLFCDEANTSELYREDLRSGAREATAITNVFSGRPARCVVNRAVTELGPMTKINPAFPKGFSAMGPLKAKAEEQGKTEFSAHYCGQSAALSNVASAEQITKTLAADAMRELQRFRP
jgi:nitronate monooxygenase